LVPNFGRIDVLLVREDLELPMSNVGNPKKKKASVLLTMKCFFFFMEKLFYRPHNSQ
jgi:hypothetical protein